MALNKYMHPRNIYKNPPNFAKLAESYEEFSNIVKKDVTGKVTIDFKNPHSLRILTKCLLRSDFKLDVMIPEDRLVPTLPLRLNYILWVEDLLRSIQRTDNVYGLDIGTGACAIYPLLAAVTNKWHMMGTETDDQSLLKAEENVQRNNLQGLIELKKNLTTTIMKHLFSNEDVQKFDFSMCNPPFYCNIQELCESRSPARHPPKNGFTGSHQELITDGGELTFCRKMIEESKDYKNTVLIFTTMVGHKYNLKELEQDLQAEGIKHTSTEFCQGRVTRWGLAWTFQDYDLYKLLPGRDKPRKKNTPIAYLLPQLLDSPHDMESVAKRIKTILQGLNFEYKVLNKRGNNLSLDVKALSNTWSNQRRKRRLMKKQETYNAKKLKIKVEGSSSTVYSASTGGSNEFINSTDEDLKKAGDKVENPNIDSSREISDTVNNKDISGSLREVGHVGSDIIDTIDSSLNIRKVDNNIKQREITHISNALYENAMKTSDTSLSCLETNGDDDCLESTCTDVNTSAEADPVVHAFLKLVKKENNVLLEMEFLDGTAGKEGVHQIVQYIKNSWK